MKTIVFLLCFFLLLAFFPMHTHNKSSTKGLVYAIAKAESNFKPRAVSKKGAVGIMQIRPVVWERELKKMKIIRHRKDLFNPMINVEAGRYILGKLYVQYKGDMDKVLRHYSGGARNYKEKVYEYMK